MAQQRANSIRHLIEVRLQDVSCVGIPAYDAATLSLRSLAAQVSAPLSDVLDLARDNRLCTLLSRTDNRDHRKVKNYQSLRTRSGAEARKQLTSVGPRASTTPLPGGTTNTTGSNMRGYQYQ